MTQIHPLRAGLTRDRALALAGILEQAVHHPLARAFTAPTATTRSASAVRLIAGAGVEGRIEGRVLRLGRPDFAAALWQGAPLTAPADGASSWLLMGDETGPLAWFAVADPVRPDASATLARLRALGLSCQIASGDAKGPVSAVARAVGCAQADARLTPEDKLTLLDRLQTRGERVLAVGDGVNDAPLLARADVSVAMAAGTALAHTSADLILLQDRLSVLPDVIETARRTRRIIRQNLAWALAYNALAVPLAAAGLVTPWLASLGMSLSSVLVVLNAQRLYRPAAPTLAVGVPTVAVQTP